MLRDPPDEEFLDQFQQDLMRTRPEESGGGFKLVPGSEEGTTINPGQGCQVQCQLAGMEFPTTVPASPEALRDGASSAPQGVIER